MKHLIQYHKAWEHGDPLRAPKPYVFTSKESLAMKAWTENARVWLIYRKSPDDKKYFIGYTFKVSDINDTGHSLELYGEEGATTVFTPQISLSKTTTPWFSDFLSAHGNFGLGLLNLSQDFVEIFEQILLENASISV